METRLEGPGGTSLTFTGGVLRAAGPDFERAWRVLADGSLSPESFVDRVAGIEWVAADSGGDGPSTAADAVLEAASRPTAVEGESLTATLRAGGVSYRLQLFPGVRGVRIERSAMGTTGRITVPAEDAAAPSGIETDGASVPAESAAGAASADRIDGFALAPLHLRLVQVSLQDQTDVHNELAWEREWLLHPSERALALSGCLFFVEDVLTGAGLVLLKEAPLPYARPVQAGGDLEVATGARRFTLRGEPGDDGGAEYPVTVFAYSGGRAGRTAALHAYQRARRPYVPGRDGLLLTNTWGDRNRDGRIRADFIAQEVEAAARLGADIVQIDDGWQIGATTNSVRAVEQGETGVWEGYYANRDDFWSVNAGRFPEGLAPLIAAAREKGMRFGLWYSPDSSRDFANSERDSETLLGLHRTLGVDFFKMDGVKVVTRAGERGLHAVMDRVQEATGGRVVFDLDVTAQVRPGYFGLMHTGPLFVENRYTDWRKYWPHTTLRNLWTLAHYVDPVRLRMEWLNHARNTEKYAGDALAPAAYRPDYLFATVMFSSPLGWFEASSLPEAYFTEAAPLIATWKAHRERLFGGSVLPIGDAPDGAAWTGFASVAEGGVYVLVFREANPAADWSVVLPSAPEVGTPVEAERLGGDGEARLLPGGTLKVTVPESHRFFFGRVTV